MPTAASLSQDEWTDRLAPLLDTSLREVSERITSHPSIQSWLHEASYEVAQEFGGMADMQAETQAYGAMIDRLEQRFPALVDAVHALTDGCGRLDLHWRPLDPNYSRVYIDFGRTFNVDVFYRLAALSPREAGRALQTVKTALPKGTPFPNRPNTATGIAGHNGTCVGIRYHDQVDEHGTRWHRVTLLPKSQEPIKNLREEEAAQPLLDLVGAEA